MSATVIRADARNLPLADNSVDLVVTSPPYFALRSYQDGGEHYDGQIGAEPTPAEFVASLLEVTRECMRVLKPSGSLWVNLGDKYASSGGHGAGATSQRATRSQYVEQIGRSERNTTGIATKSLIGIPWRYALACIDDLGLILRAELIWSKPNGLPESVTDRVRRSHEQWFHFTLNPRYFSAVDEIREAHVRSWGDGPNGGHSQKKAVAHMGGSNLDVSAPNPLGKLPGSVWTVPTEPLRVPDHLGVDHFAAFPTEWPKRIIQGWSPAGVCVECGEGRRPVSRNDPQPHQATYNGSREAAQGRTRGGMHSGVPSTPRVTITGYACACAPCDHDSHYMTEDDGHSHWRCLRCGQVTECGCTCPAPWNAETVVSPDCPEHQVDYETCAATDSQRLPPTTPAVVLDCFGGTGTTAMVAKALGRHGITVDMSADYCRLAEWRTNDRNQIAKVLGIAKAEQQPDDQLGLWETA